MNKKAALGGQTMFFVFLMTIIIIAAGIGIGVSAFFSTEYDFRQVDSVLLNQKISQCLSSKNLNLESIEQFASDFYEICGLNKNSTEKHFFIHIDVNNKKFFEQGSGDQTQCSLGEDNDQYMECTTNELTKKDKKIFLQTGSKQKSEKLRT